MFLIHPIFQSIGILIAFYVMRLGIARFQILHLNQKTSFNWKKHVLFGFITMTIWLLGFLGGLYVVKTSWYSLSITGFHFNVGLLMIPFIFFAIGSGIYMDRHKKRRIILPLIHAIFNIVMLFLSLLQVYTGVGVYRMYVLGLG